MPTDHDKDRNSMPQDEYRRQHELRAKRRKKKRTQKLILLGAFAVAAILLIVCVVMIFNAIFGGGKKPPAVSSSSEVESSELATSEPPPTIPIAVDPTLWNLKLVNEQKPLSMAEADYMKNTNGTLAKYDQAGVSYWFDTRMYNEFFTMINDCNANVAGGTLRVNSGYRGYENQNKRFTTLVGQYKAQGKGDAEAKVEAWKITQPAGMTEHHTGLAVDFVNSVITQTGENFDQTEEFKWLVENAANYGFVLRYPANKVEITGVPYKPWHWRFVGVAEAQAMSLAGITLEEYVREEAPPVASTVIEGDAGSDSGESGASTG